MGENDYLKQAAAGKNSIWRYLGTIVLILMPWFFSQAVLLVFYYFVNGTLNIDSWPVTDYLITAMLPFGFGLLGLCLGVKWLHQRPLKTLFTAKNHFRWKLLALSALLWFGLSAISDIVYGLVQPGVLKFTFQPQQFFPFFLLTLVLVPIQISTEELIFRGYLMQGSSLFTRGKPLIPLLLTSLIFGGLHFSNPEMGLVDPIITMVTYILTGLFLGFITIKSNGLELALGMHFANNLYAANISTFPGSAIPSPSLFTYQAYSAWVSLVALLVTAGLYLVIFRIIQERAKETLN